jgi:hypothetical protein
VLIAKQQHLVLQPGVLDRRECRVVELSEIDATNLGAKR